MFTVCMNIYKSSVFALTLSIVSLSAAMMYQSYMQSQVLGTTTGVGGSGPQEAPTRAVPTGSYPSPYVTQIPPQNGFCSELTSMVNRYCGPTPTSYQLLPDLSVTSILASPEKVKVGEKTLISFVVTNIGKAVANTVTYTYSDMADGVSGEGKNTCTGSLKPNESCLIAIYFTFPTSGEKTLMVKIDPTSLVNESNESNNDAKVGVTVLASPTPTVVCKTGVNNLTMGRACSASTFASATYMCYDGVSGEVKSASGDCITSSQLSVLAAKACSGHSSCSKPTPTPTYFKK